MSRDLADLHPTLRPLAEFFIAEARGRGFDPLITCTYRDETEQARLYAQGRTTPGRIVTWARPGLSLHNYRIDGKPAAKAFDFVPMRDGKPVWSTRGDDDKLWRALGELGESCGLVWAGRWPKGKREYPHLQLSE